MKIINHKNHLLYIITPSNPKKSYLEKGLARNLVMSGEGKTSCMVVDTEVVEFAMVSGVLSEYRPITFTQDYVDARISAWKNYINNKEDK